MLLGQRSDLAAQVFDLEVRTHSSRLQGRDLALQLTDPAAQIIGVAALFAQRVERLERRLAVDLRTRDYVKINGRSYRREELTAEWILEQFPPDPRRYG